MGRLYILVENSAPILSIKNVVVRFGGVTALNLNSHSSTKNTVDIYPGEIVALIGPNGAGKSTLLKAMFGLVPVSAGTLEWQSRPIEIQTKNLNSLGVAYVGQDRRVFATLSVLENIQIGGIAITDQSVLRTRINEILEQFPDLCDKLKQRAGELSGGQQQMVAIARELISHPTILLLDEPSLGLSPKVLKDVFAVIKKINSESGVAIVLVEHNITSALKVARRTYILDKGKVVYEGSSQSASQTKVFKKIFLSKL